MGRANPLRGLLLLADAMGGQLESRIRMQKSVYLLKLLGTEDFRATSFRYHHYGPYSRSLSDTLQDAIASDLLLEKKTEYGEEQSKYTYEVTELGRAWLAEDADRAEPNIQRLAPLFRDTPWRTLELAATILFVERDEQITDRALAAERALELKPACAEHDARARELLSDIGL